VFFDVCYSSIGALVLTLDSLLKWHVCWCVRVGPWCCDWEACKNVHCNCHGSV